MSDFLSSRLKSRNDIDFKGMLVSDVEDAFRIGRRGENGHVSNVKIKGLEFRNVKYGFVGSTLGGSKFEIIDCNHQNDRKDGNGGNLISGNATMHNVTVRGCRSDYARIALAGATARAWRVVDCHSYHCFDTPFYMKGSDHIVEDCTVEHAGKDGFKSNQWKAVEGFYSAGESRNCHYIRCSAYGYGEIRDDSGAAFNMSCIDARLINCTAYVLVRGEEVRADKTMRGFNFQRPGNRAINCTAVYPDLQKYEGYCIQDSATGTTIMEGWNERTFCGTEPGDAPDGY